MLKKKYFQPKESSVSLEENNDAADILKSVLEVGDVTDKSFNEVHWRIALDHAIDEDDKESLAKLHAMLTSAQREVLEKIVEKGPVEDGDIPSKSARDELEDMGMVVRVAIEGEFGNWAATGLGFYLHDAVEDDE